MVVECGLSDRDIDEGRTIPRWPVSLAFHFRDQHPADPARK
jgi:hypothetical protein